MSTTAQQLAVSEIKSGGESGKNSTNKHGHLQTYSEHRTLKSEPVYIELSEPSHPDSCPLITFTTGKFSFKRLYGSCHHLQMCRS